MNTITISGSGFWASDEDRFESSIENASVHERFLQNDPLFTGEYITQ